MPPDVDNRRRVSLGSRHARRHFSSSESAWIKVQLNIGDLAGQMPGFLAGIVTGVITGVLGNKVDRRMREAARSRSRAGYARRVGTLPPVDGIVELQGIPDGYQPGNVSVSSPLERFYIPLPEDVAAALAARGLGESVRPALNFTLGHSLADVGLEMGIADLDSRVERHRAAVARQFIDRTEARERSNSYQRFNNEKFGIRQYVFEHVGTAEIPSVRFSTYKTDYFTHSIMHAVHAELREEGHAIGNARAAAQIQRYYPFLTSLGVNCFVVTEPGDAREEPHVIFVKRSRFVDGFRNAGLWHVSMNEGFSVTDVESDNDTPRLDRCVRRDLEEELGILPDDISSIRFFDVFFVEAEFELGITAIARVTRTTEQLRLTAGKDTHWEREGAPTFVPYRASELRKFLVEAKLTRAGLYFGQRLLSRMPFDQNP